MSSRFLAWYSFPNMSLQNGCRFAALAALLASLPSLIGACGDSSEDKYSTPATQKYTGAKQAKIPDPPALPTTTPTADANKSYYTVFGATHHFRSAYPEHMKLYKEVTDKSITIRGYVVKTNYEVAGTCAHPQGKEDPKDCAANPPPVPTFWIADNKGDSTANAIQVVNWAHNWSAVFDAVEAYAKLKDKEVPKEKDQVSDKTTGNPMPFPLPAVGARVKVTGKYGPIATNGSSGDKIGDPRNGVISFEKMETEELAPEKAAFPTTQKTAKKP